MAYTDYQKALKTGEKTYKNLASKGKYPYLPVLEDMIAGIKDGIYVRDVS